MIKIHLKNGALLEKPKVIIDDKIVGRVSSGKPLMLDLISRKTYYNA